MGKLFWWTRSSNYPLESDALHRSGSLDRRRIAGLIIIEASSFEDAVEIAKACPGLHYGLTVEVRLVSSEPGELELAREKEQARQQSNAKRRQ